MTVACVCIHLSCHWKGIDIPRSSDGKNWWEYIDQTINKEKLDGKEKSEREETPRGRGRGRRER